MSFAPVIPLPGLGGYAFLQRTREDQQQAFDAQPRIRRNVDAFAERIGSISTAAELVDDRQMLEVALGAFGLDEDINNRYLIEQILASNTSDPASLASRFSDKRYIALSRAFGFGDIPGGRVAGEGFADRIVTSYRERQFETAAGEIDPNMRLALGFDRDLADIAARQTLSADGKWFTVMATPPLRQVFETALGLPKSFGTLDLDQQLGEFKTRARKIFGTDDIAALAAPDVTPEIVEKFLVRAQIQEISANGLSGASIALSLLQGAG